MSTEILEVNSARETKLCSACKKYILRSQFIRDVRRKDGLYAACKFCHALRRKRWIKNNPDKYRESNRNRLRKYMKAHRARALWKRVRCRCRSSNNSQHKYYGAKGIELRLTCKEFCRIFDEQRAYLLSEPIHTHRIDPKGHYERGNVQFMNASEHIKAHKALRRNK